MKAIYCLRHKNTGLLLKLVRKPILPGSYLALKSFHGGVYQTDDPFVAEYVRRQDFISLQANWCYPTHTIDWKILEVVRVYENSKTELVEVPFPDRKSVALRLYGPKGRKPCLNSYRSFLKSPLINLQSIKELFPILTENIVKEIADAA